MNLIVISLIIIWWDIQKWLINIRLVILSSMIDFLFIAKACKSPWFLNFWLVFCKNLEKPVQRRKDSLRTHSIWFFFIFWKIFTKIIILPIAFIIWYILVIFENYSSSLSSKCFTRIKSIVIISSGLFSAKFCKKRRFDLRCLENLSIRDHIVIIQSINIKLNLPKIELISSDERWKFVPLLLAISIHFG